jgi:tryptophanyl-tRNA synthetase
VTTLCGFRPTGRLHLGHFFSIIKPARQGATVLVADYHAPQESYTEETEQLLRAFGVQFIERQCHIFDPDLFFRLLSIARVGDLNRMTQFKSAMAEPKKR